MFKNCHNTYLTPKYLIATLDQKVVQLILEKNIKGKTNQLKQAAIYMILSLLTIFMVFFNLWFSIFFSLVFTAIFFVWINKYRHKFGFCNQFFEEISWDELLVKCCRVLEFIKFSKMIQEGYELRTNTNIIVQRQQEQQGKQTQQNKLSQDQIKLQKQIVDIEYRLRSLYELSFYVLHQFSIVKDDRNHIAKNPMTFKDCFCLYSSINELIRSLSNYPHQLNTMMKSPFLTTYQLTRVIDYIAVEFKTKLCFINWKVCQTLKKVQNLTNQAHKSPLYQALQGNDIKQLENIYKTLSELSQYHTSDKNIDKQYKQNFFYSDFSECPQLKETQEKVQGLTEVGKLEDRKKFMAKLDILLLTGLARRRAEQMEEDSKIKQFSDIY